MGQNTIKTFIIPLLFFIGFMSLMRTFFLLWSDFLPDFFVYYSSIQHMLEGKNPYTDISMPLHFLYPPVALVLFFPLSFLSFSSASSVWLIILFLCFIGSIYLLYKIKPMSGFYFALFFLGSVFAFPTKFSFGMGQINPLVLFLIVLFLYYVQQLKMYRAVIILGFVSCIKVFPIVFIAIFFIKKQWQAIVGFLISIFILFFISYFFVGQNVLITYTTDIFFSLAKNSPGAVYYNQSLGGIVSRLLLPDAAYIFFRFSIVIISFLLLFRYKDYFYQLSLLITMVLLVNTITWQHHLLYLMIPFYYLLLQKQTKRSLFILSISYVLIAVNISSPKFFQDFWYSGIVLSHGFFGMLLLWTYTICLGYKKTYDKKQ